MSNWQIYEPATYENHPFYNRVTEYNGDQSLTIEDDGSLELEISMECCRTTVNIPHSVLQALLVAYSKRTQK